MAKMKILVVDYDPATLKSFRTILSKNKFEIDTAGDGKKAIYKINKGDYDCVLASFLLPDIDGKDLLLFIKESLPNAVKIMADFPSLGNSIRAIELGADALFSKPVKPEELISILDEMCIKQKKESRTNANEKRNGFLSH